MGKLILTILLALTTIIGVYSNHHQQERILQAIRYGVRKLIAAEQSPSYLFKAVKNISNIKNKAESDDIICKSCEIVVNHVITYRRTGASKDSMETYLGKLCKTLSDWGDEGCKGYIDIELDTILFIIDNKRNLTPERVCAINFVEHKCVDPDAKKWVIPLPPAPKEKQYISELENGESPFKILHLTDIHYDPLYKPGSNAVCKEPLCCSSGIPAKPEDAAGYWGDYRVCDMPRHSVTNLLDHIKHNITLLATNHGQSWEYNRNSIKEVYGLFASTFVNKTVYPILGNHEPHPTDFFSPKSILQDQLSTQWIFDLSVSEWSRWLPENTHTTIRKGGFYTVLVKPGFRIIALNSNFCFNSNLWLVYDDEDPRGQLAWLVEELYKAEKNKERVHILSHIPPGEINCHKRWSNQFRKIINRFAHIISAQFNGHTHIDEFRVFFDDKDPNNVTNVAFNGASFTTFVGYNPNFRIYQVNPTSAMVLDYDQYIFNLTKANEKKTPPDWFKEYSFKEAYNLPELSFKSFGDLLGRMAQSEDLLWQYFRFLVRDSDVKLKEGCGRKCLKKLLCLITAVETSESVNC